MHYYHCGLSTQFLAHVPGKTAQDGPTSRTHASQARAIIPGCCFDLAQSQPSRPPGEWTSRLKIVALSKKKKSKLTTDLSCGIFSPFPNKGGSHGILRLFESEIKLLASHWDITSITLKPVPKFLTMVTHMDAWEGARQRQCRSCQHTRTTQSEMIYSRWPWACSPQLQVHGQDCRLGVQEPHKKRDKFFQSCVGLVPFTNQWRSLWYPISKSSCSSNDALPLSCLFKGKKPPKNGFLN